MVKEYQETANFMYGAHNGDELKRMAASQLPCFPPQKFFVKRALVLSETDYHFFVHDDFRNPPYALKALRQCMGFDMENQAWNCVLVVSETGKDGILVSKEPNAERYYMAHIPEHGKLHLPSDLPIEFWTNVCTTNLQLQPTAEINPPKTELENRQQHFASFVGMEMSSLCFALRFVSYDPQKDEMVTRLYGDSEDYMESRGTPEKIAEENHFVGKLREIFFDMDYRNICSTSARSTTPPGEGEEPYKRKKGGTSSGNGDAPPLLSPYPFSFFFFRRANARRTSSMRSSTLAYSACFEVEKADPTVAWPLLLLGHRGGQKPQCSGIREKV